MFIGLFRVDFLFRSFLVITVGVQGLLDLQGLQGLQGLLGL